MTKKKIVILALFVVILSWVMIEDDEVYIFYTPHQDDETLFMSSAIINAVDNDIETIIVLVTDGSKSNAIHLINDRLENEEYAQIDTQDFVLARNEELLDAASALGVNQENVYFMNKEDSNLKYEEIETIVKKFDDEYRNATHITLIGDYFIKTEEEKQTHDDHRLIGNVVYDLSKDGTIDRAHFISYIEKHKNIRKLDLTSSQKKRYIQAMESYNIWDPENQKYAIGYTSVGEVFDHYRDNPVNKYYEVENGLLLHTID